MNNTTSNKHLAISERLLSLDVFRGLTMFLLIGEATFLYEHLLQFGPEGGLWQSFVLQFHHHPWNGLRFWDLIQPFFMFIVGVAMPFSFAARWAKGQSWSDSFKHAVTRSAILLFLGWALYCIGPGRITFELWDVLAQLSVTYLIAFLIMRKSMTVQFGISIGLLLLTEVLYRTWSVPGYDQAFTPGHNFGSWMDMLLMGKVSAGHWIAFNAIPTSAHTIWGVLAGMILMSKRDWQSKLKIIGFAGLAMLAIGYGLDSVTPIVKRISTTTFVFASGGWALLTLAFLYWLIDVRRIRSWAVFSTFVGMNPLFIYLFSHTGGTEWFRKLIHPFVFGIFSFASDAFKLTVESLLLWGLLWALTYWLYKKKIFIRI